MQDRLNKIRKKYQNTENLLEIYLENYHNNYIYIRIDYYKKLKKHKLSWIDLEHFQDNFESVISYEYMPEDMIRYLKDLLSKIDNYNFYKKKRREKYVVYVKSGWTQENYELIFNQFINKEDVILDKIFNLVFENLPLKLSCFYEELSAPKNGTVGKFECEEEFEFDLFTGDLKTIFDDSISVRGEEFYKNGRVLFLEKIKNEYVAIVGDTSLYVVSIKYDDLTKCIQMRCLCPDDCCCYHFYAVVLAIREKRFKKFYKVIPNENNISLLDKVMNFQFLLSIGMDDQGVHFLIIDNNQLCLVPVFDEQRRITFKVLEDDENETLSKRIAEVEKNKLCN